MANNILVTRSSMPDFEEYTDEIKDIWQSHWLTNMGVKHQQLQKDLVDYMGVEKLELVVNGHLALELSGTVNSFAQISSDILAEV